MAIQKTTSEIRQLLINAKLDFESIQNKALNDYLPKILHICPFIDEPCATKQCVECEVFTNSTNKRNLKGKQKT